MILKRRIITNPIFGLKYQTPLINKLVMNLLKDGKKSLAVRLVNKSISILIEKLETSKSAFSLGEILELISNRLTLRVNFVKRRSGSRNYRIPYHIDPEFGFRLGVKKLIKYLFKRNERGLSLKLAEELWAISQKDNNSLFLHEKTRMYNEAKSARSLSYMISKFRFQNVDRLRIDLKLLNND